MKMKLLIATALTVAMTAGAFAADKLKIATEGAYPPFNEKNAAGELIGFDVDIAKALCEKMNRECEIIAQDWDGIIPGLVNNKYDAIIASMSITDERKQSIDFAGPYYSSYLGLVAKKGSGLTQETAITKPLGAQRSTVSSNWAEEKAGSRGDVKLYDTQTAAYEDLKAGRVEVLVSDLLPVVAWLKDNPSYELIGEKIDINDKIGIGIRQKQDTLKASFDKALSEIRADGTYKQISEKYFGVDIF